MMQGLDRYLTTEPEDGFTPYAEQVIDKLSDEFHREAYVTGDFENSDTENRWLEKMFRRDVAPEQAAKIIERAYKIFKL